MLLTEQSLLHLVHQLLKNGLRLSSIASGNLSSENDIMLLLGEKKSLNLMIVVNKVRRKKVKNRTQCNRGQWSENLVSFFNENILKENSFKAYTR